MISFHGVKSHMYRSAAALFLILLIAGVSACGGSGDGPVGAGPVIVELGNESSEPVPGAPLVDSTPTPSPTIANEVAATATATPPSKTLDEISTGKLVDELSFDEYKRTSARDLEREFRKSPETAAEKVGKKFVVQGDVLEAGNDASGQPFVSLKAGLGRVTCLFKEITDAELRRFTPDGTNSVVGTVDTWDAENRVLTLKECNVVLGF